VIPHKVKKTDSPFTIKKIADEHYDIEVHNTQSKYFSYLINSSRIHWRKELETELEQVSEEEEEKYLKDHKFCIDGSRLTEEEIFEQKQHLINKIFSIGYLLHRYKSQARAWAVFAMDAVLGEEGESNGRSGKSFGYKALR